MKVSVNNYAEMCKVSRTSVYNRIKNGLIKTIRHKGSMYIDIKTYPPLSRMKAGRPSATSIIH